MKIGNQIKILREDKNISKEQMADELKLSINTYKKIEYNERSPSLDELLVIASKLEVDISYFLPSSGFANINNGPNSPGFIWGNGNSFSIDKTIMDNFTKLIDQNQLAMNKMSELVEIITKRMPQ